MKEEEEEFESTADRGRKRDGANNLREKDKEARETSLSSSEDSRHIATSTALPLPPCPPSLDQGGSSPAPRPLSAATARRQLPLLDPASAFIRGRLLLPSHPSLDLKPLRSEYCTFRVLSYHVLAQCNTFEALSYCLPSMVVWERRRAAILDEITSYQADIICLQDVDKYKEWWQPELNHIGYDRKVAASMHHNDTEEANTLTDYCRVTSYILSRYYNTVASVFKRRTSTLRKNHEGVVVAWRREELQAFRIEHVNLNDAIKEEPEVRLLKALADDVATFVLLQPTRGLVPCALCVANTQFHTSDATPTPHLVQARYLAKRIQRFNGDFQAPVLLCGSMNSPAGSLVYEALCTGRKVGGGGVPRAPARPTVESLSRSSIMVKWPAVPASTDSKGLRDFPILGYWVSYQPGGNTNIGFNSTKRFAPDEQCKPSFYPTFRSSASALTKDTRLHAVTELSSNVAYEFRVAAENANGIGPWSLSSEITETRQVDYGSKSMRYILGAEDLARKREEEKITAEVAKANKAKQNDYASSCLPGLSTSQSSALGRPARGHVYATETGAEHQYRGGGRNRLVAPVRRHMLQYFPTAKSQEGMTMMPMVTTAEEKEKQQQQQQQQRRQEEAIVSREEEESGEEKGRKAAIAASTSEIGQVVPFHVVERGGDAIEVEGGRDDFHENSLRLCSAYSTYGPSGEPAYTTLSETSKATVDYIFHSAEVLVPFRLLSLPSLDELDGMCSSTGQQLLVHDHTIATPLHYGDDHGDNQGRQDHTTTTTTTTTSSSASWLPSVKLDLNSSMYLIPNQDFPSSHLAIMAEFGIVSNYTTAGWRSFRPRQPATEQATSTASPPPPSSSPYCAPARA